MNHNFSVGQTITVENGVTEMLYSGKVEAVQGDSVTVRIPGQGNRPFVFNVDGESVTASDRTIFAAW